MKSNNNLKFSSEVQEAATFMRNCLGDFRPEIMLILGTGLNSFIDSLKVEISIPYDTVPHMCASTAPGHVGSYHLVTVEDKEFLIMQGRLHAYEGLSSAQICFPIYLAAALGIKTLVITNASGAINPEFVPGEFGLIEDHINLTGRNPLAIPTTDLQGPRFIMMEEPYSHRLMDLVDQAAHAVGMHLKRGVYFSVIGSSFETKAEIRAFRIMGADFVGASTVEEVIVAQQMGMEVCGITFVSNMACGVTSNHADSQELSIEEINNTVEKTAENFGILMYEIMKLL